MAPVKATAVPSEWGAVRGWAWGKLEGKKTSSREKSERVNFKE